MAKELECSICDKPCEVGGLGWCPQCLEAHSAWWDRKGGITEEEEHDWIAKRAKRLARNKFKKLLKTLLQPMVDLEKELASLKGVDWHKNQGLYDQKLAILKFLKHV